MAAPRDPGFVMGDKALRTRDDILRTAKQLFLDRGFGGTRIEHITKACGIARSGFYTYFPSKRDVFLELGAATYREVHAVVAVFDDLPLHPSMLELEGWVHTYFDFLAEHGAFMIGASQTGPDDEDIRGSIRQLQPRVCRRMGRAILRRRRAGPPAEDPLALGAVVLAMLDRAWFLATTGQVRVDEGPLVRTLARRLAEAIGD